MTECDINGERFVLSLIHSGICDCNRYLFLLLEKVICFVLAIIPLGRW